MYSNIKNFLEDTNPQAYNFEFECEYENVKAMGGLKRYLVYKATGEADLISQYHNAIRLCFHYKEKYPIWTDCDRSDLVREVYRKLWGWGEEKCDTTYGSVGLADFEETFGGDTMNSAQTVFDEILKGVAGKGTKEYNKHMKGRNISLLYALELYYDLEDALFSKLLEKEALLEPYIELYHTLGNFVLVPKGYNTERNKMFEDFWDRSLAFLQSTDNQYLLEGEFTKYINYFFLWDYVYLRDEANYGVRSMQSKAFTETRGYSGPSPELNSIMPSDDEIPVFLGNAISAINRRGIFMTAMLRLASELPEAYKRLRDKVYISAKPYSGYGAVIEAIRDELGWIPEGLEILQ